MILSLSLLLGILSKISDAATSCPVAGAVPQQIAFDTSSSIFPMLSLESTVCVLVHVTPKDPTTTPAGFTSTSHSSDYIVTPVSRSYDEKPWENVAGPFRQNLDIDCTSDQCEHSLSSLTSPYNDTSIGAFYLIAYSNSNTFDEELVRFFSQSTYGATRSMITNWKQNYENSLKGMADWVKDQMTVVPVTSLRATYRKNADFSLMNNGIESAAVVPRNPCEQYSRWRDHTFSPDDFGKLFEVESITNSDKLLITFDGTPRGIVDTFESTDGTTFSGPGSYTVGYRVGDVGGTLLASKQVRTLVVEVND